MFFTWKVIWTVLWKDSTLTKNLWRDRKLMRFLFVIYGRWRMKVFSDDEIFEWSFWSKKNGGCVWPECFCGQGTCPPSVLADGGLVRVGFGQCLGAGCPWFHRIVDSSIWVGDCAFSWLVTVSFSTKVSLFASDCSQPRPPKLRLPK